MAAMLTTRKKRVSKKSKSSWRKHSDVQDVDEFLESKRVEEIQGGPISSKKNEELFKIDTKARKITEANLFQTRKDRLRSRPQRCYSALVNESSVKDPVGKRDRVVLAGEAKGISKVRKLQATVKRLKKDARSLNDSSNYSQLKSENKKEKYASLDIWGEGVGEVKLPNIDEQWLRPQTLVHNRENFAKVIGQKTKYSRVKNSALPSVEAPHPGESYNPTFEDHQDLLQKVADHEGQLIKNDKHIERVTTKMFCKQADIPTEEEKLKELAQGLPVAGEPIVDDDLSDTEFKALNPPVQNKKKSLQKRRNLKLVRDDERKKFSDKIEKKKVSDIYRLKLLEEEMSAEKVEMAKNKDLKLKSIEKKSLLPKQMSRYKYEAPEFDFNMPKDIKGSVRKLKTEGSILVDRFKSMQKRNVIETRIRQKIKRKFRPKRFTKASHKIEAV